MELQLQQPSNSIPSVLFLDQPFAAGMVHLWLREYFFEKGFTILGGELPPWKENLLLSEYSDIADDYLNELDWDEMIRHTVARLNGRYGYNLETGEQKAKIINCFKDYAKKMERQFSNDNVRTVVIFGNYRIETKLGAFFSHKYQVQLICIESFFLQSYFYLEPNSTQIANHHAFIQKWPFIRNLKVTDEQLDKLDVVMRERESHGLLDGYINMPEANKNLPDKLHKLSQCKGKVGLVLGQVSYDAVIVNDLTAFPQQILFIRFIIEQFLLQAGVDDLIVCRLHPLEARYGDQTIELLQQDYAKHPQVLLLSADDCNTYQLMEMVDFGIVANSQSGLEMIYRDKPVLVCGNPYYAVAGFCLQATDQATIQVQVSKLLAGWHPTEKDLAIAKQYLCGLIFHHLCLRNKTDVWQKLDAIPSLSSLQNQQSAKLIKDNKSKGLKVMPNAKVGHVVLDVPDELPEHESILVVGTGTFAQHFALHSKFNLTFCSDLPADCQLTIENHPVSLIEKKLLVAHKVIVVSCPQDKWRQLLTMMDAKTMHQKTIYHIEKIQKEKYCEFNFTQY